MFLERSFVFMFNYNRHNMELDASKFEHLNKMDNCIKISIKKWTRGKWKTPSKILTKVKMA